ncbi:hypothetical protein, partial [Falsiroseomonas sp.]|uniref:hypothetical protein n=1 Tax=Falsiroseomonas sp. TaxID=2870721 RepID=UPI00272620A9
GAINSLSLVQAGGGDVVGWINGNSLQPHQALMLFRDDTTGVWRRIILSEDPRFLPMPRVLMTSGGTTTATAQSAGVLNVATGTVSTHTHVLPAGIRTGQFYRLVTRVQITALTLQGTGGNVVRGWTDGSTVPPNSSLLFHLDKETGSGEWYRC